MMTNNKIFSDCEIITSRQNRTVIEASKLQNKKQRDETQTFLADGVKLFCEANISGLQIVRIFLCDDLTEALPENVIRILNEHYRDRITVLSASVFDKITAEKAPQGIVTQIKYLDKWKHFTTIYYMNGTGDDRILLLDSIQDPGNVGTIIRSAAAFGIDRVIIGGNSADITAPKTIRASMGAVFKVKIDTICETAAAVDAMRACGRNVFAAELSPDALRLDEMALTKSDVFLIGNEGNGIEKALVQKCTRSVYIPMTGLTESLNASVAASVCMWQQYIGVR